MSFPRASPRGPAPRAWFLLLLVMALGWPVDAPGAAWTREPGEVYAKASLAWLGATQMFDDQGDLRPIHDPLLYEDPSYQELGAALYLEYGLHRAITLVLGLPVKLAWQQAGGRPTVPDIDGETFGLGSMRVAVRAPLHRGRWRASFEPEWILPLYGDPDRPEDPALGTGFMDLGGALSVGAGIPSISGYAQGTLGYRLRGGSTPEERYWDLEVGSEPVPHLMLRLRYDGLSSKGRLREVPAGSTPAPGLGGQDHHRIAPTIALDTGGGRELSLTWRGVVDGRSTLRSSEWEVAVAFLGLVRSGAESSP